MSRRNYPRLTDREMEVLRELSKGTPIAEVAKLMQLGEEAVVNHLRNIAEKLQLTIQLHSDPP